MSFSGFKKQLNKANQYVSEKIGSAEPTKPTQQFIEMEKQTDLKTEVVEELIVKTKDLLYPNPAIRAKIAVNSKIKGAKKERYPHPENALGESMTKYGNLMGKESLLGKSLIQMGITLKETTEIRYSLEETAKKKFLEPLTHLQLRDIKDCAHHRKKLEGRRLDYDCKKRKKLKGGTVFEADLNTAEQKYVESLKLTTIAMQHLLDSDPKQISQLVCLSEALNEYHTQCANIFKSLTTRLKGKCEPLAKKLPDFNNVWTSAVDTTIAVVDKHKGVSGLMALNKQLNNGMSSASKLVNNQSKRVSNPMEWTTPSLSQKPIPKCRALYDFKVENGNELAIKEGDIIELIQQIDDNWFEGTLNGKIGLFPVNYVEVLVPISR